MSYYSGGGTFWYWVIAIIFWYAIIRTAVRGG